MVDVIRLMNNGVKVYAMVAPAIEGQFGADVSVGMIREAVKALALDCRRYHGIDFHTIIHQTDNIHHEGPV